MPNVKSSIKRMKIARIRTEHNKSKRSELKTAIRRFNEALASNSENKQEFLRLAIKKLDKAASKNLIHKNKASRKKSQLMRAYNAASQASE
jgi:small subunit ribosomal protein S20